jgi:subtilisin family serine protease
MNFFNRKLLAAAIAFAAVTSANAGLYPVVRDSSGNYSQQSLTNANTLHAMAMNKGTVRVEIILNDGSANATTQTQLSTQQRQASALQAFNQFKSGLGNESNKVSRNFSDITLDPFFEVNLTAAEVTALLANSNVKSFSDVTYFKPFLNQSNSLLQTSFLPPMQPNALTNYYLGVIDSGVDNFHNAFGGRVFAGACFPTAGTLCAGRDNSGFLPTTGRACTGVSNCGHGTHVAGIAASSDVVSGMAPTASIFSIMAAEQFGTSYGFTATGLNNALATLIQNVSYSANGSAAKRLAAVNLSLGELVDPAQTCGGHTCANHRKHQPAHQHARCFGSSSVWKHGGLVRVSRLFTKRSRGFGGKQTGFTVDTIFAGHRQYQA